MISSPNTRRSPRRTLALVAALALFAAAGCSGSDDSDSSTTTRAPQTTAAGTDAGSDNKTDADGIDLGENVVVIGEEDLLADVLALGVRPIAATATTHEAGFQGLDEFDTSDIEVLPTTTLSLETLAALQPDTLIVLQFWVDQVDRSQLDGLADQLLVVPNGLSTEEQIVELGTMLGREARADDLVAELAAARQAAIEAAPDDCEVSVAAIYPGPSPAVFVSGPWVIPSALIDLGCTLVPSADGQDPDANGRVYLSLENLDLMAGPRLFLMQAPSVVGDSAALEEIERSDAWATLPAVQADAVTVLDRLGYPGAPGHIRLLEELPDLLR